MIDGTFRDRTELEPLMEKPYERPGGLLFCGRLFDPLIEDWINRYGKERVVKAVVLVGALLTFGLAVISGGAVYAYSQAVKEKEADQSVAFFVTAFAAFTLSCFTFFICTDISCKAQSYDQEEM